MKIACILLASGFGRRYGGNKLLTLWEALFVGRGFPDAPYKTFPLKGGRCPSVRTGADEGGLVTWIFRSVLSNAPSSVWPSAIHLPPSGGKVMRVQRPFRFPQEKETVLGSKEKGAPVGVRWSQIGFRRPGFTPP